MDYALSVLGAQRLAACTRVASADERGRIPAETELTSNGQKMGELAQAERRLDMRGLSEDFMDELLNGVLRPLRERVRRDHTLCLEIRDEYINIYYRGGNLLKLARTSSGYVTQFDDKYVKTNAPSELPPRIQTTQDVDTWLNAMPHLKQAMDFHFYDERKEEREAQQLIVRENNFGRESRSTDFYCCDLEYANAHGRFDLVAVHWPSDPVTRKKADDRRLVIIEAKYGDTSLDGKSGLHSHTNDIYAFLRNQERVASLKEEMVQLFNQKRALGLIDAGKDLVAFSEEPPMFLLALANHDPGKIMLHRSLESLPSSPEADVYIATGCFMGYGLFDQAVVPLSEARSRLSHMIGG